MDENADGSTNYDLERAPSRVEALVLLVRALGKDAEAETHTKTHPFEDVPVWADGYVSYAYENGLVRGVSATRMDSKSAATTEHYLTYMLRALEYTDGNGNDFIWDNPFELARYVGILPDGVRDKTFLRSDAAAVTCAALFTELKGGL